MIADIQIKKSDLLRQGTTQQYYHLVGPFYFPLKYETDLDHVPQFRCDFCSLFGKQVEEYNIRCPYLLTKNVKCSVVLS